MLGWGGVDQATCEVVDSAAELLGVLKRLIKSQDISGDTGAVPVEELGRAGVRNPAVELSEVGGQCTGTGGLGATAWRSQGREVEPQIACYGAGNLFNAEATANEPIPATGSSASGPRPVSKTQAGHNPFGESPRI